MARNQPVRTKPTTREYHVYDPAMKLVGNVPVVDRGDGSRVIILTQQQAQYLIDQGSIGLVPEVELSDETLARHRAFRGKV